MAYAVGCGPETALDDPPSEGVVTRGHAHDHLVRPEGKLEGMETKQDPRSLWKR